MAINKIPKKYRNLLSCSGRGLGRFIATKRIRILTLASVWVLLLLATAAVPLLSNSPSNTVSAAPTSWEWLNAQTIRDNEGAHYLDNNVRPQDGTHLYFKQASPTVCANDPEVNGHDTKVPTIDIRSWSTNGPQPTGGHHLYTPTTSPNDAHCSLPRSTISINKPENSVLSYNWIDKNTIRHFQIDAGGGDTKESNMLPDAEYKWNESQKRYEYLGQNSCVNNIDNIAADGSTATVHYAVRIGGECRFNANYAIKMAFLDNYKLANAPPSSGGSTPGTPDDAKPKESCETNNAGRGLGWLLCDFLHMMDDSIDWIDKQIQELLVIKMDYFTEKSFVQAWGTIRNIALLILVPIMLVMVIATALEIGPFDAYTVRKSLPRFLFAVLFIVLSLPILKFFVQLSNVVETGILGLITSAFGTNVQEITLASLFNPKSGETVTGIFGAIAAGGAAAAAFAGGAVTLGVVFSFALVALVGLFIGYVVLLIRILLVVGLVLLAPIAILPWIFPGNDKLWKTWKNTLVTLLMLGPILGAFIGVARMLASLEATPWWLKVFFYVGVYFLIITFIKSFGGVLGTVLNGLNDKTRGFFDKQRKYRASSREHAMTDAKMGNRFKGFGRGLNSAIQTGTLLPTAAKNAGFKQWQVRSHMQAARSTVQLAKGMEDIDKDATFQPIKGNDDLLGAALHGGRTAADARAYLSGKGYTGRALEQNLAHIEQARRSMGQRNLEVAATVANASTGTGYGSGPGEMLAAIAKTANGDMSLAGNMLASMKSRAQQSSRFDLSGAGYGDQWKQLQAISANPTETNVEASTEFLTDKALDTQGPGAMLGGRSNSVKNLLPAMQRRITKTMKNYEEAVRSGDQAAIQTAERARQQVLASTAGLLDVASQVSPENARLFADNLMAIDVYDPTTGQRTTLNQAIENNRGNPAFDQMRREYGSRFAQEQAERRPVGMTGPPTQPPTGPPMGPV